MCGGDYQGCIKKEAVQSCCWEYEAEAAWNCRETDPDPGESDPAAAAVAAAAAVGDGGGDAGVVVAAVDGG